MLPINSRRRCVLALALTFCLPLLVESAPLPKVADVEQQPLAAQVRRLTQALEVLGSPLAASDRSALEAALRETDPARAVAAIQDTLDAHCLIGVNINPESRVKVAAGPAKPELAEQGWRTFLVKVHNEAGVTAELRVVSPNAESVHDSSWSRTESDRFFQRRNQELPLSERWLDVAMFNDQPLRRDLSGLKLEYRIIQTFFSRPVRREK